MSYNWQQLDWTKFSYNLDAIENLLFDFAEKSGWISGFFKGISEDVQTEALIDITAKP
jgi:Fic family protein